MYLCYRLIMLRVFTAGFLLLRRLCVLCTATPNNNKVIGIRLSVYRIMHIEV